MGIAPGRRMTFRIRIHVPDPEPDSVFVNIA
jgi:hypothetical protein